MNLARQENQFRLPDDEMLFKTFMKKEKMIFKSL